MIEITPELLRRVLDGDTAAQEEARDLLPKVGNLFGRWATHPDYGRVLCVEDKVDHDGLVIVRYRDAQRDSGSGWQCPPFESLTFDPVELFTEEDFMNAPEGTIVIRDDCPPRVKDDGYWESGISPGSDTVMAKLGPWQVLRWGKGEQE